MSARLASSLSGNDFVAWDMPYAFCDRATSGDPDFSEVICQGEADIGFDASKKFAPVAPSGQPASV